MLQFVISSVGHTGTNTAVHGKNWPILFYSTIQVLQGGIEENYTKPQGEKPILGQYLNTLPPETKQGMLPTQCHGQFICKIWKLKSYLYR
jgi:hypothetical protein